MHELDALEELARLASSDMLDQAGVLSEATRIVGAAIGSPDVRLITGDGVNFEAYPVREKEDFFGLSRDGLMSASEALRRLGRPAVYTIDEDGLPRDISPADGRSAGDYLAFSLSKGDWYAGAFIVASGPWAPADAGRAGRFLELAGPALALMFERVSDAERTELVHQQMNALADVARVFTRSGALQDLLGDVVTAINSATGFFCNIDVLDAHGQIATRSTAASRYTGTPLYHAWLTMSTAPDPIREMILKDREPVLLPDIQSDPRISEEARQFYKQISMTSGATFPLLFQQEVVGLLRVGSLTPESFPPPTVDLLRGLAIQAAVVVKGVQLRDELQRSRKETERYAAKLKRRNEKLLNEVSERRRAEKALRGSEEKYRDLVENINEVIYTLDQDGRIAYVSPAVKQLCGYTPEELVGRPFSEFVHADDVEHVVNGLQEAVCGSRKPCEYRVITKSGELKWVRISGRRILDGERVLGLRAVLMDITERKQAESQVEYMAYHDSLTALPNRTLLRDRLATALAQRRRDGQHLSVMFLDLDRFKLVNDTVGHALGDEILQRVGERLTSIVREGDTVARWGGDEFTVLLSALSGTEDARDVATRILERFRQPWALAGHEFLITSSIGIALWPQDGDDAESLLRNADTAMYRAKEQGRDNYQVFTSGMNASVEERVRLESDLRKALRDGELVVYYQPQVNTDTGRIVGMEALVRWQHPERGIIYPGEFIPLAEETGLILPLGEWVLSTACAQNRAFQDAGLPAVRIGINLSSRQFQDPGLVGIVARVLKETGLDAQYLDVEITEGTAMRDVEFTVAMLSELRGMGVHVSIDDFGTGYSSLAYMRRLPIDSVKIDGSFVADAPADADDAAVVAAIVALGRTLGLRVIAEGVETVEQLAILKDRQCHEAQGYLFARAVPSEAMARMLARGRALGTKRTRRTRLRRVA